MLAGVSLIALAGSAAAQNQAQVSTSTITTYADALVAAYTRNPSIRAQRERLRAIDEQVPQALSGWRPTVFVNGAWGYAYNNTNVDKGRLSPQSYSLTVTQPLYRGGRTVNATREAEAAVRAGRATVDSVEQTVLLNTTLAYIAVLRDVEVVELGKNNVSVLERELRATGDRFEVGEVTRTDVAQAEARLALAQSSLARNRGALEDSRAAFVRATGASPGELEPIPKPEGLPESHDAAVEVARANNPDIQTARFTERSTDYAVRVARGALLPTVSLQGELEHTEDGGSRRSRSNTAQITGQVSVPLYQAGAVWSQVREALASNSEQKVRIAETERQVLEAITNAWEELITARAAIKSDEEQVRANEIAFDGVSQEAQVGTRTTLDVLDAEQELLNARVALVSSRYDEIAAGYRLLTAMGVFDADAANVDAPRYSVTENYERNRNRWWGYDGAVTGNRYGFDYGDDEYDQR